MSEASDSASPFSRPPNSKRPRNSKPNQRNRPPRRPANNDAGLESSDSASLKEGDIELEFGIPFAGRIAARENWTQTALKRLPESDSLDFDALFNRQAPRVLDIGCGNGRFTLASAVRRPDQDHIGIDPLPLVIRYATRRANQRGLANVRWAACDGMRFLSQYCRNQSLAEIHVYHPQPYQRDDERSKRLFTPEFFVQLHRVLQPNGKLFVQTDNQAYWEYLSEALSQVMHWHSVEGPWPEDPTGRTRREIIALHKGLKIYRGWGERNNDLSPDEMVAKCQSLPQPDFVATPKHNPNRWRRPPNKRRR